MTEVSREELHELAGEVVRRLGAGMLIRIARSHVDSQTPRAGDVDVDAQLSLAAGATHGNGDAIACMNTYKLTARMGAPAESREEPQVVWTAELEVHGQWQMESLAGIGADHIRAFAMKVGLMALHPYARAHVQNSLMVTGWPPFTIDVLTSPEDIFAGEHGLIALDGVSLVAEPA